MDELDPQGRRACGRDDLPVAEGPVPPAPRPASAGANERAPEDDEEIAAEHAPREPPEPHGAKHSGARLIPHSGLELAERVGGEARRSRQDELQPAVDQLL